MKNSISCGLSLLLFSCLLYSCQKQDVEVPSQCQSIAYVIEKKDGSGNMVTIDTSIYWPRVCGDELARFRTMNKEPQPICGQPGSFLQLVIWSRSLQAQ